MGCAAGARMGGVGRTFVAVAVAVVGARAPPTPPPELGGDDDDEGDDPPPGASRPPSEEEDDEAEPSAGRWCVGTDVWEEEGDE